MIARPDKRFFLATKATQRNLTRRQLGSVVKAARGIAAGRRITAFAYMPALAGSLVARILKLWSPKGQTKVGKTSQTRIRENSRQVVVEGLI